MSKYFKSIQPVKHVNPTNTASSAYALWIMQTIDDFEDTLRKTYVGYTHHDAGNDLMRFIYGNGQ